MKEVITQMLKAADPSIRFEVLERFSDLADCEDDVRSMINLLENDGDPCVRHEAAAQLIRIEEKKPHLMTNLRQRAIAALLERALNDESTVVRHESIEVLGYIGDERSLQNLTELAMEENLDIRSTAEIALRTAERRIKRGVKASSLCADIIETWRTEHQPAG
jgi:HEAT repeat protein